MRKTILVVISLLVPFAAWTSGCRRNDKVAAFPKGPEVKNLARASSEGRTGPRPAPFIPASIDPEVISAPDQPTFARIRAVVDRQEALAARHNEPGLFVLPREDVYELATTVKVASPTASTGYEPLALDLPLPEPIVMSGRELASAAPAAVPSAPARAGKAQFWSSPAAPLPAPRLGGLPLGGDVSAMAPPMPPPDRLPPPPPSQSRKASLADPLLLPEAVPGVFTGRGTVENFDGVGSDPLSSLRGRDLFGPIGETSPLPFPDKPAAKAPVAASDPSMKLGLVDTESIPLAFVAPSAPPAEPPPVTSAKIAALLDKADIRRALAPLPDLLHEAPVPGVRAEPVAAAKDLAANDVPALAPPPPPPPMEAGEASGSRRTASLGGRWEPSPSRSLASRFETSDAGALRFPLDMDFAPLDAPVSAKAAEVMVEPLPAPAAVKGKAVEEAPRKVTLTPVHEGARVRPGDLKRIDAMVDVPPMKY